MKLRTRLTLAFLLLAGLVGGAGGFGLFYIMKVTQSAEIFSDVTMPIVTETTALVDRLQELHIALLGVFDLDDVESHLVYAQQLAGFEAAFAEELAKLRQLIDRAQLHLDLANVVETERAFVQQASDIISAHQTKITQAGVAEQRLRDFEAHRQQLDALLTAFISESEGAMAAREDRAKTLTQSGEATVEVLEGLLSETLTESYPIVQGAYKLIRYLIQMQDTARAYVGTGNAVQLAALEERFQQNTKASASLLRKLKSRAIASPSRQTVDAVAQGFAQLGAMVLTGNGLFAAHRASLEANINAKAETLQESLINTSHAAEQGLRRVERRAKELNEQAKESAHSAAHRAQTSITFIILLSLTTAVLVGVLITRSITRPLQEAVRALKRIAEGDLTGDIQVYANDETGQLLQSMLIMQDKLHQLYGTLESRLTRLQALTHLNQLISSSLDMGAVLGEIAQAAASLMGVPCVHIWTADAATSPLALRASSDDPLAAGDPTEPRPFDERSVDWVAHQRRPCISPMSS